MDWTIHPHVGVGPIRFGMTQEEVRAAVGQPYRSFMKSPSSKMPTDAFPGLGLHVHYKPPGHCNAVEMGAQAQPRLHGKLLIGRPLAEIRDWLRNLDPSLEIEDSGLTSKKLGIGIYAPGIDEDENTPVEGVIAFEPGYYD